MLHSTRSLLHSTNPPLRPEHITQSNLIFLPLPFIHHLPILVHPFRINSVDPSLVFFVTKYTHPIDDTLAWYRNTKNTTSSRKHASLCKIGILMMNLVVRTPSYHASGLGIPTTHAKKSSITVDSVLYTIAFIGICATL